VRLPGVTSGVLIVRRLIFRYAVSMQMRSLTSILRSAACGLVLVACATTLTGCLKRTISVTSQPEGAIVWINDVEVGRTPLETDFTFYGVYDVRLRREGYEPVITSVKAAAPIYDWPGLDLLTEAAPINAESRLKWHFELSPVLENRLSKEQGENELIARANELRTMTVGEKLKDGQSTGDGAPKAAAPTESAPAAK
jgi:hypothetical protein